ncbi:hypothetical protein ACHAQJ_008195 [Trichoderma viride]
MAVSEPKYPDYRHAAEARRLRMQGALVIDALGGNLVLCPLDLSHPGLRILDSATADGHFLTVIRGQLADPESAELVGTDIAPFPPLDLPDNITLAKQDILQPWPEKWEAYFDLVHQRNALSVTGGMEGAVAAVKRFIGLIKPGGWIQLVDGSVMTGELAEGDKAVVKLLKVTGWALTRLGLNPTLGASTAEILRRAGEGSLQNLGERQGVSALGKGAATAELEEMGYEQLRGLHNACMSLLKGMPQEERPITVENFEGLLTDLLREAREGDSQMTWYAAWGQKI